MLTPATVEDVDPDDGPLVRPPIELIVGLSNVMILIVFDSSMLIVVVASRWVFKDVDVLQVSDVAAIQTVDSHLINDITMLSFGAKI